MPAHPREEKGGRRDGGRIYCRKRIKKMLLPVRIWKAKDDDEEGGNDDCIEIEGQ